MSSCVYSVGATTAAPDMISSDITLTTTALADFTIESVATIAYTATTGSVVCNVSIGGTQKASYTQTLDGAGDTFFFVDFVSGGALPGALPVAAGQEVALSFVLGTNTTLLGANPSNQSLAGFAASPNVAAATTELAPYLLVNRSNSVAGNWTLSTGSSWPMAVVTQVRPETGTPTFFSTVPLEGSQWTFATTVTTAKLGGAEANAAFYFPPLRMPATLVEGNGIEFGLTAGGTALTVLLDANALMYQSDTTVIQPRIQVDINAGGNVFILGDAFQTYQDFEGFPLESIVNPVLRDPPSGRTAIGANDTITFFMHRTAGASTDWAYDPFYGTCTSFGGTNELRMYNMVEQGVWGWNYGPAATNVILAGLAEAAITQSKAQGYQGWPPVIQDDIFNTTQFTNNVGAGSGSFALCAPLSTCHRAVNCITWGTGVLGTGYTPAATSIPYSLLGKVTVSDYDGVTSWTATNATNTAPIFVLGNLLAATTGNGVLLVPHYIDRVNVYTYTTNTSVYTQLDELTVLGGSVNVETNKVTVAPANLLTGSVANLVQGAAWASSVAALVAHPNVQTVATSSLHIGEIALASNKEVMIMKFGDRVVGAGGKFQDFIETYTSEAAFVYAEPKTFVVDPPDLAAFTLANFQGRTTYTAAFGEQDVLRATYGIPYQGFLSYARYIVSNS